MPKVIFRSPEGVDTAVEVDDGYSVMEAAVDNQVDGMVAECGGACACATCHVYVDAEWVARLPEVESMEDAIRRRHGAALSYLENAQALRRKVL